MDPGRSPCPYRLIDDTGGAFMIGMERSLYNHGLGAIGGAFWKLFKGFRESPKGARIQGIVNAVKKAHVYGGRFVLWMAR